MPHSFTVGENIQFQTRNLSRKSSYLYRVVATRPAEDGDPCYLIKCEEEQHSRIARQSELRSFSAPVSA
jgi:hypothetical protein